MPGRLDDVPSAKLSLGVYIPPRLRLWLEEYEVGKAAVAGVILCPDMREIRSRDNPSEEAAWSYKRGRLSLEEITEMA